MRPVVVRQVDQLRLGRRLAPRNNRAAAPAKSGGFCSSYRSNEAAVGAAQAVADQQQLRAPLARCASPWCSSACS